MSKHRADRLPAAGDALAYQRDWFNGLHEHVAAGGRFALVNADTPHEILRAFDIPYVVNQWWSSIAASRSGAQRYLDLLAERGLPRDSEQYNAIGIGSAFDPDPSTAPWGGLPRPFLVLSDITGDLTRKVFDVWGAQEGVTFFALANSAEAEMEAEWWADLPHDWERLTGTHRIDLLVDEMQELITFLEEATGTTFDPSKLERIMALGNEQAEWNRRTRDLLASATPCPVSVNDSISAVMVPQWHRGTEWGRDAARQLFHEVEGRIEAGSALASPERARLMWVGRGLWFDLGFYRHFEAEYGAVFRLVDVSRDRRGTAMPDMATIRCGHSRRASSDSTSTSTWPRCRPNGYVQQARQHRVDGVVHLVSQGPSRANWATTRALEAAGIPVIEVHADNADDSSYDVDEFPRARRDVAHRKCASLR
jgi:hypothetical protein